MNFLQLFLLILALLWPLLLVIMIAWAPTQHLACRLSPAAAWPALLMAVLSTPDESLFLPSLLLGITLAVDETGHVFLVLTALLWWLAAWYAKAYLPQYQHARFFTFFNLAMLGNVGLTLAQDMLSFYLFFSLMSLAAYGLVVHTGTTAAIRAGKIYIVLVMIGEAALFAALALTAVVSGTLSFDIARPLLAQSDSLDWIMSLSLIGFGLKAGVIILHVWLPLAHPVAPTPASAVLSGSMIKAGLLGWLRLLPLGEAMLAHWGAIFIILGLSAAFYAVVVGLSQRDAKTLLAYSSVSQMGVLTTALGLGLMMPSAWPSVFTAILFYTLHHGLAKGSLFLGVGIVDICTEKQRQLAWIGLWLPALALAGAPFTSGMIAKSMLKELAIHTHEIWNIVLQTLLPCGSIATALLLGKFLLLSSHWSHSKKSAPAALSAMLVPWVILLMTVASLPWWPLATQAIPWSYPILLSSLWPILLTGLIILGSATHDQWLPRRLVTSSHYNRWKSIATLRIPPGDILIPLERGLLNFLRLANRLSSGYLPYWRRSWRLWMQRTRSRLAWQQINENLESFLGKWVNVLTFFLCLSLILAWWSYKR